MTNKEQEACGWDTSPHNLPMIIELEGGLQIYAQADDEGNGPGAMILYQPKSDEMIHMMEFSETLQKRRRASKKK